MRKIETKRDRLQGGQHQKGIMGLGVMMVSNEHGPLSRYSVRQARV